MLDLASYDVSARTGFLPTEFPDTCLLHPSYAPWEQLVANLPALILSRRIRSLCDKLGEISTANLGSEPQWRRAYLVLGFLAHAYVWAGSEPADRLPKNIATPLQETAAHLGLPPLATYAGLCLWNFREILPVEHGTALDVEDSGFDLSNLTTINTFTGSIDEQWFYLVSVFFEARGARAVRLAVAAAESAENGDVDATLRNLQQLAEAIDHLGSVLMRMEEHCDPHVFYFRLRPYLAGWKNMADVGLKGGVYYGDETTPQSYAGGSNAQSSLIQCFDSLLGVRHYDTGERPLPHEASAAATPPSSVENSFLLEMQSYMPRKHRHFLQAISQNSQIQKLVKENPTPELVLAYDACLAMLKAFRDKHIQIVTRYIILQAKKAGLMGSLLTVRSGLARRKKAGAEERGTGGTALLPFLKQCRDETGDPAAGSWGKRLLSDGVMRLNYSKPNAVNED